MQPRVGLVGAGLIGRFHARGLHGLTRSGLVDAKYVGVCDREIARAEEFARIAELEMVTGDANELIESSDINTIYVCTPTAEHKALVLAAAFIHASWNYLLKRSGGGNAFVWLFAALSAVLYAPLALAVVWWTRPPLGWMALALMLASAILHTAYYMLLDRGYRSGGDLSLVYPLARGSGPLITVVVAVLLLGENPSRVALAGAAPCSAHAEARGAGVARGARGGDDVVDPHDRRVRDAGVVARRLRAIGAVLRATARLDGQQRRKLHGVRAVMCAMHVLSAQQKVGERQREERLDRVDVAVQRSLGRRFLGNRNAVHRQVKRVDGGTRPARIDASTCRTLASMGSLALMTSLVALAALGCGDASDSGTAATGAAGAGGGRDTGPRFG